MKKIDKRKIFLVIIIILILIVIALFIGKFTFSYLAPDISEDINSKGEVTASGDTIIFNNGKALTLSATTDNFTTGGTNLTSTTNPTAKLVASSKTNKADATYYVGVYIKNNTYTYSTTAKTPEVLLTIKDEKGSNVTSVDGLTYTTSGGVSGFDVTDKTGLFNIKTDYPITTASSTTGTTHTWTFTLTFVNLSTDQSVNENANMNLDVYLQKKAVPSTIADVCSGGETLASCVTTLKQKDALGISNIYYHDANLANGAGDNSYRFAGASDQVNNYVCFGSSTTPCPADNLYRIIGVFGDKVKLIKSDYATSALLGTDGDYIMMYTANNWDNSNYKGNNLANVAGYSWNYKNNTSINSGNGSNTWSTSLLNTTNLNKNFIANIGADWAAKIAETTWKVGGNTLANIGEQPAKTVYQNEIVSPVTTNATDNATTYSAKVGLMYVSDYGFAAAPSAWTINLNDYDGAAIKSVNWMYMGLIEWTISRTANNYHDVFSVSYAGGLHIPIAHHAFGARPVFYLSSSVNYVSGSGGATDPIIIN